MPILHKLGILPLSISTLLLAPAARADLFTVGNNTVNTGVNSSGTPLADGTIGDPHWQLVSVPSGTTDIRVRTSAGGYPIPPYIGDDALSAWIGPNNDAQLDGAVGNYTYQTTFSLAGFNPATASLTGQFATDNNPVSIELNGVSVGTYTPCAVDSPACYSSWTSLTIGSGAFVAGTNTLDFVVQNTGGPTAFRLEMTGTADPSSVPEPTSILLLATAVALTLRRVVRV